MTFWLLHSLAGICLLLVHCNADLPSRFVKHAVIGNLGHHFVSHSDLMDLNDDGSVDMILSSLDGELLFVDLLKGYSVKGHWPSYIHGEHFFARPISFYQSVRSSILFIGHTGNLYSYILEGFLMEKSTIPSVEVTPNTRFMFDERLAAVQTLRLDPRVYSSGVMCDFNEDGKIDELILPVNYVDENRTVIVASLVVIHLTTLQVIHTLFLERTLFSHHPAPCFMLADLTHYLEPSTLGNGPMQSKIVVALASGRVYAVHWQKGNNPPLSVDERFPLTANAPVTTATVKDNRNALLLGKDDEGTVYAWSLKSGNLVWKYHCNASEGTSTPLLIHAVTNAAFFATSAGYLHAISLPTGESLRAFPLTLSPRENFLAPGLKYHNGDNEWIAFLSEQGQLHAVELGHSPIASPPLVYVSTWNVSSRLAPRLLHVDETVTRMCVIARDGSIYVLHPQSPSRRLSYSHDEAFLLGVHDATGPHSSQIIATGRIVSISFTFYVYSELLETKDFVLHVQVHGGRQLEMLYDTKISASELTVEAEAGKLTGLLTIPFTNDHYSSMRPFRGRIWIVMCLTKHYSTTSVCAQDSLRLSLNWEFLHELYWLLLLPYLGALVTICLYLMRRESLDIENLPIFTHNKRNATE